MCEWLSCGEWCDVRILSGSRSFDAHRAVLASVSRFLRNVLLACPDDLPVFIILPEFDLEAISTLLCYIYNGEVVIPKHKLKMFFDTANAMGIFIDQQYLLQLNQYKEYCLVPKRSDEIFALDKYNICYLRLLENTNGYYFNVKKTGPEPLIRQTQKSITSLNLCDNSISMFRGWSEENVSDLETLTSVSGYRQRQSLARDIFIETHSRDGNINGHMASVRAIANENYHADTSFLLSGINGKHHKVTDALSDTFKSKFSLAITESPIFSAVKKLHNSYYKEANDVNRKLRSSSVNQFEINKLSDNCTAKVSKVRELAIIKKIESSSGRAVLDDVLKDSKCTDTESRQTIAKVTILNAVSQSPWHPQQPYSYTPLQKQIRDSNDAEKHFADEVFLKNQDYDVHMKRHSSGTRYRCEECHKTFSQLRNYKYHMSVHRGTKEFSTTCTVCGKHFNDRGYLSNHMKIHRNRKEYKCAFCPKSFNQRVAFNMHVRIHTGVKPHVCDECGKAFSRKMLLKQHQRTHSGERPYACAHCDKRFADRSNMTLHLRLHTGVKPFSCTLCPKSFTKKHHLKSHLNFHTGAKPYSCPRCQLAFTQSSNMRTHFKKCDITK